MAGRNPRLTSLCRHACSRGLDPRGTKVGDSRNRAFTTRGREVIHSRTLMRPPVVKRQTTPRSGFLAFFPLGWSRRSRHPGACSDFISTDRRRQHVAAPHTSGGSVAMAMASAERHQRGPLRPRNVSIPSYRPIQQGAARSVCTS